MKPSVSAIILTFNEENNIEDCLKSIHGWAEEIFIVDSNSTDKTLEIARKYTDKIYSHDFVNQSEQLNWTLDNLPINGQWIMRLDADERVTPELTNEFAEKLGSFKEDVSCLYMKRRVYFMGRWIRHGASYSTWHLRIWKSGSAVCEKRSMDEHMQITKGGAAFLQNDIIEDNRKGLTWWIDKHNNYATREAMDFLTNKYKLGYNIANAADLPSNETERNRRLKRNFYYNLPMFLRPFLYFLYRYLIRLGFLDGREGLTFHFLQGFWYRFLVDAKIYEIGKIARK